VVRSSGQVAALVGDVNERRGDLRGGRVLLEFRLRVLEVLNDAEASGERAACGHRSLIRRRA